MPTWIAQALIGLAAFGAGSAVWFFLPAVEALEKALYARRDYYARKAAQMTNPADPPPEPAEVGSAEGAHRLRAALEDAEADTPPK